MTTKDAGRHEREARFAEIRESLERMVAETADDGATGKLVARTIELFGSIHDSNQPEKEKLREKDLVLIRLIRLFIDLLRRFRVAFSPALLLVGLVLALILIAIEEILWELKKLPGRPPWSQPEPTPGGPDA